MKNKLNIFLMLSIGILISLTSCQDGQQNTQKQKPDYAKIYTENFKTEKKAIVEILDELSSFGMGGENSGQQDSLKQALELYDKGEYEQSRVALNEYLKHYTTDDVAKFYLGMCLMNQSMYGKAIKHLQPLTIKSDFELRDEAMWYSALCFMVFEDGTGIDSARKLYTTLSEKKDFSRRKDAKAILEQILPN